MNYSGNQAWNPTFPFSLARGANECIFSLYTFYTISVFHKTSFTKKHVMIMVIAVWLFGPAYNASRDIPTSKVTSEGICLQHAFWPSKFWSSFSGVMTCVVNFILPLILIVSLYISIFLTLNKRVTKNPLSEGNIQQSDIMNKVKINVLKTFIFVTTCFFLCWIWNDSWYFLFSIGVPVSTNNSYYHFSVYMMDINCCINPFCYPVQYREFQEQFRKIFCKRKVQRPEQYISKYTSSTSVANIEMAENKWALKRVYLHTKFIYLSHICQNI